jgi:hypothetical protein
MGSATFLLVSCGGGGGGSGGSSSTGSSGTGTVAVSIADNPTDDYEAIYVTITEVSLLPGPVVIYESSKGKEVDLLEHRDNNDYLLKVNYKVYLTYGRSQNPQHQVYAQITSSSRAVRSTSILKALSK